MAEINDVLNAAKSSVRDPVYEKDRTFAPGGGLWFVHALRDDDLLPPWGNPRRDWVLRQYSRAMYNTLFMSTLNNLGTEIASTPWQLYGKRNKNYYQKLLLNAEFGEGWRAFVKKLVRTFGTCDSGVYIEIISRGDALKPVAGRVEGIATLDPLYCEVTGNIQYPVIFRSQTGGYHRLHTTRVRRFVDDPQVDRDYYGKGLSALSRYFGWMYAFILMGRYNVEKLSDLPPAGMAVLNNIANFEDVVRQYEADRRADGQSVFRNVLQLESYDPAQKASVDFTSFSQLPEQFDLDVRMRHEYNIVALALGVDPQDVAPLTGQALGSGQQSFILDAKAKRKMGALILSEIQTFINSDVLPAYLELDFTQHDEEGAKAEADTAQAWVNVANSAAFLTNEQKLQLVANKVQAVQDIVTDKDGNILYSSADIPGTDTGEDVPLDDTTTPGTDTEGTATDANGAGAPESGDGTQITGFKYNAAGIAIAQVPILGYDIEGGVVTLNEARAAKGLPPAEDVPEDELQQLQSKAAVMLTLTQAQVPMEAAAEMVGIILPEDSEPEPPAPPPFAPGGQPPFPPNAQRLPLAPDSPVGESEETDEEVERRKAYSSTRDDFERAIAATINSAVAGDLTRVRAGIIARAELDKFGRRAMLDGLADGGVTVATLEGDDLDTFNRWKVEQSAYVSSLMDAIFKEGVQYTGDGRSSLWAHKSLDGIYQKGLLSADSNGLYEWRLGKTEAHCATCLRMNGAIKRLSKWHEDGILPQGSELECGGWQCDCTLKRRRKKALHLPLVYRYAA
jgi:hypothetical protein